MKTVQIFNVSKGVVIAQKAALAITPGQRMKGLLGRNGLRRNEALIIKPCSSIHTFFMRFAIDVLFLNRQMEIIKAIHNMQPNRLSPVIWSSQMAVELPAGQISHTRTTLGDTIELRQQ